MSIDFTADSWGAHEADRFASQLSVLRRRTGMSQRRLAKLAELSQTTVAAYETGKKHGRGKPIRPTARTIIRLARALATDLADEQTIDPEAAPTFYDALMRAAGYEAPGSPTERLSGPGVAPEPPPCVVPDARAADVSRKVHEAFGGNAAQIEDFFLQCGDLSDHDREFVLATVSWLKGRIAAANAYERTRAAMRAGATMHQDDPVLSK